MLSSSMDSLVKLEHKKTEVKSENQSLLGAVEPLDWLFTADSEPEPLSSPKLVNVSTDPNPAYNLNTILLL